MSSVSRNSQRLASSPHGVPSPESRYVHFITTSASNQPTLPIKPCCQGEEDHGRRQSDTILRCEAATYVLTRLHQHSYIPAIWPTYGTADSTSNLFSLSDSLSSWSSIQEGETRNVDVEFNSPERQDPSSTHSSEPSGHLDPDLFSIPPSPLDLSALHNTWEHVRAFCNNMKTAARVESKSHATIGEISSSEVLWPRNVRIEIDCKPGSEAYANSQAHWLKLLQIARAKILTTEIQKQLEDDGIWMSEETATTTLRIEQTITALKLKVPTVESEWSVGFWQEFFFKNGNRSSSQLLEKWVERRQLHSESVRDAKGCIENDPDDRLPPLIANSRHSVPVSAEPWIMTKFDQRGYAFSDILYATTMPVDLASADEIQRYPGIRLFRDTFHLPASFTVEIKPLNSNGSIGKEKLEHAIRYATLMASIMLHEELKLCYLASDDDFFPEPDYLSNHFVAAVGYKAYHFIHCLRSPTPNTNVKYESYLLKEYDLSYVHEREGFRQIVNLIYVHQIGILRDVELARLRKVLALDPEKRKYRLATRTHKHIRFSHEFRENKWGLKVYDDSPKER